MTCVVCGNPYPKERAALGYHTCLECGEAAAQKEKQTKRRRSAPAYNKGPYMYITSRRWVPGGGRRGEG